MTSSVATLKFQYYIPSSKMKREIHTDGNLPSDDYLNQLCKKAS